MKRRNIKNVSLKDFWNEMLIDQNFQIMPLGKEMFTIQKYGIFVIPNGSLPENRDLTEVRKSLLTDTCQSTTVPVDGQVTSNLSPFTTTNQHLTNPHHQPQIIPTPTDATPQTFSEITFCLQISIKLLSTICLFT